MRPDAPRPGSIPATDRLLQRTPQGQIGANGVPVPPAAIAALGAIGEERGILTLNGGMANQQDPRTITVSIQAISGPTNIIAGGGPLVGIVEWGSGDGIAQRAEFDLPLQGQGVNSISSGVLITVPASGLQIKARNEANRIVNLGGNPLGPILVPPIISASLAVGSRPGSARVYRTIWTIKGGAGLPAAGSTAILVPAFAQRFRVIRFNAAQPITFSILGQDAVNVPDGPYAVAANTAAPTLELPGSATAILVTNTGAAALESVGAIFEIGI